MADDTINETFRQDRLDDESPVRRYIMEKAAREAEGTKPVDTGPGRGVVGDVAVGATEAPKQILGGLRDAAVEAGQSLEAVSSYVFQQKLGLPQWGPRLKVSVPEVGKPETVTGGLVRGVAQFVGAFVPFMKMTRAAGIAHPVLRGAVAGALTDFSAFDPKEPRVSNLINGLDPRLRTPLTDYLEAKETDTQAEGRFKNALEGLGLGASLDAFMLLGKTLKRAGVARRVEQAQAKVLAETHPDEVIRPQRLPRQLDIDPDMALEASKLGDLARQYRDQVEIQRRGTRTHAQAANEAGQRGMTVDDVRGILPGTAMNDTEASAVISVLVDSGRRLKGLAAAAKSGNADAVRPFLEQLYTHAQIDPKRLGVVAEAGRTLSVMNEPIAGMNRFLKQFEDVFAHATKGITPQRLATLVDAFDTPEQITTFTRQLAKPGATDMILEVWINGLLSGPTTHFVNGVSNALTFAWSLPERALAARLGGGQVARGEATALFYGAMGGLEDAFQMAWHALRTGESMSGLQKMEIRQKAVTAEALGATGPMGLAIDAIGQLVRLPGRALLSGDEFFRVINYRAELRAQALREATATVAGEGLEGIAKNRRTAELISQFMADPPKSLKESAAQMATYRTFNQELGATGGHILAALDTHPLLRFVLPFFRTPVNLAKYSLERTPLAFVADYPILRDLMPDMAARMAKQGPERSLAIAQASLGSGVMALFGVAALAGQVTGGGPSDADQRRAWLINNQPYSLKVGGKWVSYNRLEPAGMIMGLAADMTLVLAALPEDERDNLASLMVTAVAKNITSKTYLRGIAGAVNALSDPERYSSSFTKQLAGSAVPFSSALATTERIVDPTLREARTATDYLLSRVPGGSFLLHPKVDRWGEDVLPGGTGWAVVDALNPFYLKDAGQDQVADEIVRLRMGVSLAPEQIEGIRLTDEQLYRFRKLDGKEVRLGDLSLHARLAEVMRSGIYRAMHDEGQRAALSDWISRYRQAAEAKVLEEFPELGRRVEEKRSQRRRRFDRPAEASPILKLDTESLGR